jgi:hypothetical protein
MSVGTWTGMVLGRISFPASIRSRNSQPPCEGSGKRNRLPECPASAGERFRPKARHVKLQSRLVRLLRPVAEHLGYAESELPFRALPNYDLRAADVAFITKDRWDAIDDEDDLRGAPELVI